ncbi:unnamed protein product [Arctogadus glacialis]
MCPYCMLNRVFLEERGLMGRLTTAFLKKKRENLKQKYKDLKNPPTGVSTEGGQTTAASWKWFELMHEAIGDRPSVTPPVLIVTCAQGAVVFTAPSTSTPGGVVEVLNELKSQDEQEWRTLQAEEREREERREAEQVRQAAEREQREERRYRELCERQERCHQEAVAKEERWREEMRRRDQEAAARDERRDQEAAARDEEGPGSCSQGRALPGNSGEAGFQMNFFLNNYFMF